MSILLVGVTRRPAIITDAAGRPIEGVAGQALRVITNGPTAGIVCPWPSATAPAIDADRMELFDLVADLADRQDLLPIQGGLMPDDAAVERCLATNADRFARLLDRIAGGVELAVRVRGLAVPDSGPPVHLGRGAAYLLGRRRELHEQHRIDPAAAELAADLRRRFPRAVNDAHALPPTAQGRSGAARLALLVPRHRADHTVVLVRTHLDALGVEHAVDGPWPCYSFVNERLGETTRAVGVPAHLDQAPPERGGQAKRK